MRRLFTLVMLISLLAPLSTAQSAPKSSPEIVNWGGTAFAWPEAWEDADKERRPYKPGDALLVYDVVSALDKKTLLRADCERWSVVHKGVQWCFGSKKNKSTFEESIKPPKGAEASSVVTSRFEPHVGGHCMVGVSRGGQAPGDPRDFRIIQFRGEKVIVVQFSNRAWDAITKEAMAEGRSTEQQTQVLMAKSATNFRVYRTLKVFVPNGEQKKTN